MFENWKLLICRILAYYWWVICSGLKYLFPMSCFACTGIHSNTTPSSWQAVWGANIIQSLCLKVCIRVSLTFTIANITDPTCSMPLVTCQPLCMCVCVCVCVLPTPWKHNLLGVNMPCTRPSIVTPGPHCYPVGVVMQSMPTCAIRNWIRLWLLNMEL